MNENLEMRNPCKVLIAKRRRMMKRNEMRIKSKNEDENTADKSVELVSIAEATALVKGLSAYQIRLMVKKKQLPYIQAGRKIFINKEVLMKTLYFGNVEHNPG